MKWQDIESETSKNRYGSSTSSGAYLSWAQRLCVPVFWRDANRQMHNGTITLVRTPSHVLGITNAHVADGLADCADEPGIVCQIGGAHLDLGRLIARHPTMDLATFRLSDVILAPAGGDPATVLTWPPEAPVEVDVVMYGGYPAMYREERPGNVDFMFASFAGKVASASNRNVGMVLEIERSESISPSRIPPNADLGGWSGGPVFRVVDSNGIERLELAAIIYEYSAFSEIAFAHPLSSLAEDGHFIE
ncbi:MAG: serine protease [Acidobacteria bacterium]|nr:serine protease [Acidobacteriota bacterium]